MFVNCDDLTLINQQSVNQTPIIMQDGSYASQSIYNFKNNTPTCFSNSKLIDLLKSKETVANSFITLVSFLMLHYIFIVTNDISTDKLALFNVLEFFILFAF